ncbi:MAG: type I methionyl aminopeptidase [Calditrichia bacterium]
MIIIKNTSQIEKIRKSCQLTAKALELVAESIGPGISTKKLDLEVEKFILSHGAKPAFKGYQGFPASACISVDEEIVHGIPRNNRILEEGMIVSVDIGVLLDGYYGDAAHTFAIGQVDPLKQKLMRVTKEALHQGISVMKDSVKLGLVSETIQSHVEKNGFSVVRDLVGHGVGIKLHEDPPVPNYGSKNRGPLMKEGMILAIEPMVNAGTFAIETLADGWTVVTRDRKPSAHFEHTVLVTKDGYEILTNHDL